MLWIALKYIDRDFENRYVSPYSLGESFSRHWFDKNRLDMRTRRLAALVLMRSILVQKGICQTEVALGVHIERFSSGQPYIKDEAGALQDVPFITISHSGRWIACCLSDADFPIGIDIEDMKLSRKIQDVASYAFFEDEVKAVRKEGREAFYKLWGAKEAIAKCYGKGLNQALSLDVSAALEGNVIENQGHKFFLHQQKCDEELMLTLAQQGHALDDLTFV